MENKICYINSTNGKNKLYCRVWEAENPVAILQIVHGMAEHIGRYHEFATYLANKGITVIGHDILGHGKSVNNDEELGFFHSEKGYKYVIQDIHKISRFAKKKFGNLPYYTLGHSMGSFLLRKYLCIYGEYIDGAILLGTGEIPLTVATSGRSLVSNLEKKYGSKYRSEFVESKLFDNYNRGIKNRRTSKDWLSRDEKEVDKFIEDPLCDFIFTLRGYHDFLTVLMYIGRKRNFYKIPTDLKILILSGDKDPVGNWGKAPEKVADKFAYNGFHEVTLRMYTNARHEILNETNREDVFSDIYNWLIDE